jgi:hypothetical protein
MAPPIDSPLRTCVRERILGLAAREGGQDEG